MSGVPEAAPTRAADIYTRPRLKTSNPGTWTKETNWSGVYDC